MPSPSPHAGVRPNSALSGSSSISPAEQRVMRLSRRSSSPDAESQRGGMALRPLAPAPQHIDISRRGLLLGGLLIAASPIGPAKAFPSETPNEVGHEGKGGFDGLGHPEGDFVPASLSYMSVLSRVQKTDTTSPSAGPLEAINIVRAGGLAQISNRILGEAAAAGGVFGGGGLAATDAGGAGALTPLDGSDVVEALEADGGGPGAAHAAGRVALLGPGAGGSGALGGRLERVVFTRQVDDVTYPRIVLALPPASPAPSAPAGRPMLPFAPKSSAMLSAVDPAVISAAATVGTAAATVVEAQADWAAAEKLFKKFMRGQPLGSGGADSELKAEGGQRGWGWEDVLGAIPVVVASSGLWGWLGGTTTVMLTGGSAAAATAAAVGGTVGGAAAFVGGAASDKQAEEEVVDAAL
ncbi:hypothetical protein HYH03_012539 [Edaphochlamys debaryana]|uniref:Uncharacterized protein n=1 Tax=Edaphochlamys debaryana TaxID=47281 RepID=A0A835XRI4_9CHLO|nr:hypothetical protein HYH03_012539 [Edaphochlamys debaryana]|eukprot:KAG2488913.1 hypothetical protein HYH03_012539 [Edaphochlamys debaryana]